MKGDSGTLRGMPLYNALRLIVSSKLAFFSRALPSGVHTVGVQVFFVDHIDLDGAGGKRGGQPALLDGQVNVLAGNAEILSGFGDREFFGHIALYHQARPPLRFFKVLDARHANSASPDSIM